MDLQSLTLFQMADKKMEWLSERQYHVTRNIANADTPKYIPTDIAPQSFARELKQPKTYMAKTNAMHRTELSPNVGMQATKENHIELQARPQNYRIFKNRHTYESSLDRNAVILEEQTLKLSENRDMYDRVATIYQKHTAMINSAIGKTQ